MKSFEIISDTSQNLTDAEAERYGIHLLRYNISLDDKVYRDIDDIDGREFYRVMGNYSTLQTAIPSPEAVHSMLQSIADSGARDVLCMVSAKELTGMYNLFHLLKDSFPTLNIVIFDTRAITYAAGFQTIYAAKLREDGMSIDQVASALEGNQSRSGLIAAFRTLKYVIAGGRLSVLKGALGQLLRVQPIVDLKDAELKIRETPRGKKKSLHRLAEVIKEELSTSNRYYLALLDGDNDDERHELKELLKDEIERAELCIEGDLTAVIGVHAGPGTFGACFYKLD